jgi:hypothetical protein
MADNDRSIRVGKLADRGKEDDLSGTTTGEQRIDMMWQLVVDWYALKGQHVDESQFQRHLGRIVRGKG